MDDLGPEATWLALEYIRGELTDQEMDAVEARMATDAAFYRLVRDLRAMQKATATPVPPEVQADAQAAADAYFEGAKRKAPKVRWYWVAAAASVAAIVVLSIVLSSGRSYRDRYFVVAPKEQLLGAADSSAFQAGMYKYGNEDYRGAIAYFRAVPATDQQFNAANYFLANAYLALPEPQLDSAKQCLLVLQQMGDQEYRDGRRWLLGLIYLDLGARADGERELMDLHDDPTTDHMKSEIEEILDL